jgi:hypothetical protein
VNPDGRVSELIFHRNNLHGTIPAELGNLAELERLVLTDHSPGAGRRFLHGEIPAELGKLTKLRELDLSGAAFSGVIPPDLGNLTKLRLLDLSDNGLEGRIPAELGNLAELRSLRISGWWGVTGEIPPELGNLTNLEILHLGESKLSGEVPPEIGHLENLRELFIVSYVGLNKDDIRHPSKHLIGSIPRWLGSLKNLEKLGLEGHFTGPIPRELGNLANLTHLSLHGLRLYGAIPSELQDLPNLHRLTLRRPCQSEQCVDVELCAASDAMFAWLRDRHRLDYIARCGSGAVHLTQATQSRETTVPLVAGKPALLQVFNVTGLGRARFFLGGTQVYASRVSQVDALSAFKLERGLQALVPGSVVMPGLEIVVEGQGYRIPEAGRQPVDVREVPTFDLTVIPFLWTQHPDSQIVEHVQAMSADPENHPLLSYATELLPARDWAVTAHEAVWHDDPSLLRRLPLVTAIRAIEGGTGYWMGLSAHGGDVQGVAHLRGWTSVSVRDATVIAHELGHNLGLRHTWDPGYPYQSNQIGAWGYSVRDVCTQHGALIVRCHYDAGQHIHYWASDVMSYDHVVWISDYHFRRAVAHRLSVCTSTVFT